MDWLIQEAAKDLVNAEEEAIAEEHGGERREDGGVGEEGGPALIDEDLPEEGVNADEGVGERAGGDCTDEPLLEEGVGEKQGRVLEFRFREVSSPDPRVGGVAGIILNGEEQGGAWTEEEEGEGRTLTGEGEQCLRLSLKADGAVVRSLYWSGVVMAGLGVSKDGPEDGRLPDGRLAVDRVAGGPEPCWSENLEATDKHRLMS